MGGKGSKNKGGGAKAAGKSGRRAGISAGVTDMDAVENYEKVSHPKTEEQLALLKDVLKKEILFSHLEEEELKDLLDAMYEKKYVAGDDIITQDAENGEEFFVMAEGEVDVIIGGNKVADMKEGSFGELALIYGTPRAATIRATKATICFAMDRSTYRHILMGSTIKKRKMFDAILEKVEILKDIDNFERSQVADALETEHFEDGATIIKQGDSGTIFLHHHVWRVRRHADQRGRGNGGGCPAQGSGLLWRDRAPYQRAAQSHRHSQGCRKGRQTRPRAL